MVRSRQNLSQKEVLCLILKTEVDRVLGKVGGCSGCGGGEAISRDGLEQFPSAALDKDPLWDSGTPAGGGLDGVEGGEGDGKSEDSGVARLRGFATARTFSRKLRINTGCHMEIAFSQFIAGFIFGRDKPSGARHSGGVIFYGFWRGDPRTHNMTSLFTMMWYVF